MSLDDFECDAEGCNREYQDNVYNPRVEGYCEKHRDEPKHWEGKVLRLIRRLKP